MTELRPLGLTIQVTPSADGPGWIIAVCLGDVEGKRVIDARSAIDPLDQNAVSIVRREVERLVGMALRDALHAEGVWPGLQRDTPWFKWFGRKPVVEVEE